MGEHKRILQPVYAPRISFYFLCESLVKQQLCVLAGNVSFRHAPNIKVNPFTGVLFRKYGYQFRIYG